MKLDGFFWSKVLGALIFIPLTGLCLICIRNETQAPSALIWALTLYVLYKLWIDYSGSIREAEFIAERRALRIWEGEGLPKWERAQRWFYEI